MTNDGNTCPVCASQQVLIFLERTGVPVHQNMLYPTKQAAISTNRGDLRLAVCRDCGFVFNCSFDQTLLLYGKDYDNTQTYSSTFDGYLSALVSYLLDVKKLHASRILEVGCGKGYFLEQLVNNDLGNVGFGFDPSYDGPETTAGGRITFFKRFYGSEDSEFQPDAVICRHVIKHVPDPLGLLATINKSLIGSSRGSLFIETPCVEWILDGVVFWDFFYEHCSYFSETSLTTALTRAGFVVENMFHTFGGQYLWAEARPRTTNISNFSKSGSIAMKAKHYAQVENGFIQKIANSIKKYANLEKVAIWGAGAKGVTILNLVDPEANLVECVVDLNPHKHNCFIPGTGHPIVPYLTLPHLGVHIAFVMNPNYLEENLKLIEESGINIRLTTWEKA